MMYDQRIQCYHRGWVLKNDQSIFMTSFYGASRLDRPFQKERPETHESVGSRSLGLSRPLRDVQALVTHT